MKRLMQKIKRCSWYFLLILLWWMLTIMPPDKAIAQAPIQFHQLDSVSYACYQKADWACVIKTGNQALELGYDYYYLRMRMGIAYFTQAHYRLAAVHFEKALSHNFHSEDARQYLRKSYEWGGLELELAALEKRIAVNPQFIRSAWLFSGMSFPNSDKAITHIQLSGEDILYGELDRSGRFYFGQLGLVLAPFNGQRWFVAYSQLVLSKQQRFLPAQHDTVHHHYSTRQQQFSLSIPIRLAHGVYLFPEMDVLRIQSNPMLASWDSIALQYTFSETELLFTDYVLGMKLIRQMPSIEYGLSLSRFKLNRKHQWQTSLLFNYFPFQNLNVYTSSRLSAVLRTHNIQFHFKQLLGLRATSFLWLQGGLHVGQLENVPDENAGLIYNASDKVVYNLMGSVIFFLREKLRFQIDVHFQELESLYFIVSQEEKFETMSYQYYNLHLKGGLIWKL